MTALKAAVGGALCVLVLIGAFRLVHADDDDPLKSRDWWQYTFLNRCQPARTSPLVLMSELRNLNYAPVVHNDVEDSSGRLIATQVSASVLCTIGKICVPPRPDMEEEINLGDNRIAYTFAFFRTRQLCGEFAAAH